MLFKSVFTILYFGLLFWTFILGRRSIYDNWFNDSKWQKFYLDEDGNQLTEEEFKAKCEAEKIAVDNLTAEEQMVALVAILDNTAIAIKKLEIENPGLTKQAREILNTKYKNFKYDKED